MILKSFRTKSIIFKQKNLKNSWQDPHISGIEYLNSLKAYERK